MLSNKSNTSTVEIKAWVSYYSPLFYMYVITHACPYTDAG